jgi:HAD superfamily hydrolase (TIGR01509 family)
MTATLWSSARALIFDFDGVLADSEPFWRESYNRALAPYGVSIPADEYWEFWSSKGEGLEGHLRRHGLTGIDAAAVERAQQQIFSGFVDRGEIALVGDAAHLLEVLLRPGARPLVIASNTARPLVEALLAQGRAPRPRIVGGEGLRPKPAPDIFLKAVDLLGVPPASALVIEDTEKGIRAARTAGCPVLLVRTPYNRTFDLDADGEVAGIGALVRWAEEEPGNG